jgi:hypothetical protein
LGNFLPLNESRVDIRDTSGSGCAQFDRPKVIRAAALSILRGRPIPILVNSTEFWRHCPALNTYFYSRKEQIVCSTTRSGQ